MQNFPNQVIQYTRLHTFDLSKDLSKETQSSLQNLDSSVLNSKSCAPNPSPW